MALEFIQNSFAFKFKECIIHFTLIIVFNNYCRNFAKEAEAEQFFKNSAHESSWLLPILN
jgi:hypothetical protein